MHFVTEQHSKPLQMQGPLGLGARVNQTSVTNSILSTRAADTSVFGNETTDDNGDLLL